MGRQIVLLARLLFVLLEGGITVDTGVALGLITASVGGLVGAISILFKALSSAYGRQIDDLRDERDRYRAERDRAYDLADQTARQVGRSADVADRTISLVEKGTPR